MIIKQMEEMGKGGGGGGMVKGGRKGEKWGNENAKSVGGYMG